MLTATVKVNLPGITGLQSLLTDNRKLLQAGGKGVEVCLRRHFLELDKQGNQHGWPRKHFWARTVRQATSLGAVTATSATVCIASPEFALQLHGGKVTAKRGRALAVPMTGEAYQAGSPREGNMDGLFVVRRKSARKAYLAIREGNALRLQYRLLPSVTIPANPEAMPEQVALDKAAAEPIEEMINRAVRRTA